MKYFLHLIAIAFLVISCSSDDTIIGSDSIIKETRSFSSFNEIKVSNDFEVVITHGDVQSVELTASDNLMDNIITSFSNNKLIVTTRGSIRVKNKIGLQIVLPVINKIELSDDVDCNISGFENSSSFIVVMLDDCNLNMLGSAKKLDVKIMDNSKLDGFNYSTEECNVLVSDDSNMSINCTKTLFGKVFDDSKLFYTGNPDIDVTTSDDGIVINSN